MAGGQDRNSRRDDMQPQMRDRYDSRAQDPRNDARAYDMQLREEASRRAMEDQARAQQRDERQRGRMSADEKRDLFHNTAARAYRIATV